MTAKLNITANGRDKIGSAESRRLRKQNKIPAVIYDKDNQTQFVSFDIKEFEKEYKKGGIFTTLITLEVGDKKINVITHNIDFDPLNDRPTHVEFLQVNDNQKVKTKITLLKTVITLQKKHAFRGFHVGCSAITNRSKTKPTPLRKPNQKFRTSKRRN